MIAPSFVYYGLIVPLTHSQKACAYMLDCTRLDSNKNAMLYKKKVLRGDGLVILDMCNSHDACNDQ